MLPPFLTFTKTSIDYQSWRPRKRVWRELAFFSVILSTFGISNACRAKLCGGLRQRHAENSGSKRCAASLSPADALAKGCKACGLPHLTLPNFDGERRGLQSDAEFKVKD
jgi:hypothetical protein